MRFAGSQEGTFLKRFSSGARFAPVPAAKEKPPRDVASAPDRSGHRSEARGGGGVSRWGNVVFWVRYPFVSPARGSREKPCRGGGGGGCGPAPSTQRKVSDGPGGHKERVPYSRGWVAVPLARSVLAP